MQKKNNQVDVSVITLNYKEASLTKQCVQSLLRSENVSFEIIIIDNSCSTKEAELLLKITDKRVSVFIQEKNLGCASGYNFGIRQAKGKYVFIINNDTKIVDRLSLAKMVSFLQSNPKIAVLQPKIKSLRNSEKFEYAGAAGGYLDTFGYPFCRGRLFSTTEEDSGQYDKSVHITWASTCAFFARKDVLYKAGLFDPIYFAYAEEVDISLKIWLLGYNVAFFPGAEIFHKGETSWKKTRGKKTFLIHRNHLILYFKCLPIKTLIINLPFRIFFEYLSMFYYIRHKSSLHVFFVLLSHISIVILFPIILVKRMKFFSESRVFPAPLYRQSIVVDYFVYNKKIFGDLDTEKIISLKI